MLWDDAFFYVGAELEEPHIWATLTQRDSVIFHDNDFEIFLDPDGDHHNYFEIEINALNTVWDLRLPKPYRDGGPALNEWDATEMKTAVKLHGTLNDPTDVDGSWSVEVAIPWASMTPHAGGNCPPKVGDQWKVNFSRVQWQTDIEGTLYRKKPGLKEDNWVWSPQGEIQMHLPEMWGVVQFADGPNERYVDDGSWPARKVLVDYYNRQHAFRREHNRWGTQEEVCPNIGMTLRLEAEAWTADFFSPVGTFEIRHDSRFRRIA